MMERSQTRRRSLARATRAIAITLLALDVSACATIQPGPPRVDTKIIAKRMVAQRHHLAPQADVSQEGTTIDLHAFRPCRASGRELDVVDVTEHREMENKTPGIDQGFGILGAVAALAGIYAIAAPDQFAKSQDGDQPSDPDSVRAGGFLLTGIGVACGAIAVADVIRASGSEETTERKEIPGKVSRAGLACDDTAEANAAVVVEMNGRDVSLGKTDERGMLHVDLLKLLPPSRREPTNRFFAIAIGGEVIGELDMSPLFAAWEEVAWSNLHLDLAACHVPSDDGCVALQSFAKTYPSGEHATAIRQTLEEVTWRQVNEARCAIPSDEGCKALQAFADTFLESPHAGEAQKRVIDAVARQEAREQAEQRAEELRQRRAIAAQQAAAQQKAQRQAEAAAEQRRREDCRRKCLNGCKGDHECEAQCRAQICL